MSRTEMTAASLGSVWVDPLYGYTVLILGMPENFGDLWQGIGALESGIKFEENRQSG